MKDEGPSIADTDVSSLTVTSTEKQRDYLSVIFRRCVLALAGSRVPEGTVFERDMLEELVITAEQHLLGLISHLSRISHMQRRVTPSIDDVALFLNLNELNVIDLEKEAKLTTALDETHPISTLNSLYFDPNEEDLPAESAPFFERPHQLVPSSRRKPAYIPNWMPPLPADHTYMHTESHSSQIRDLRQVRVSLVEEGRLAEKALQRLLGDKGSSSIIDLQPRTQATPQSIIIVDKDNTSMNIDDEPSKESSVETAREPSEPLTIDSRATSIEPSGFESNADDAVESEEPSEQRPRPLKLQLHIGSHKPSPPAISRAEIEEKKKLSLKLSLGKPKKKKETSFLGKRPRSTNIVELARRKATAMEVDSEDNDNGENANGDSQLSGFQAALSSFVR